MLKKTKQIPLCQKTEANLSYESSPSLQVSAGNDDRSTLRCPCTFEHFDFSISITNPGGKLTHLFLSVSESLSPRSRWICFPLVCVRVPIPQPRDVFVMQNCSCRSPGNNIWLVDKSLPGLLHVSSLHKSCISIPLYCRMIYVTKQHSMNCNFYNQIYNLHYIFRCIF